MKRQWELPTSIIASIDTIITSNSSIPKKTMVVSYDLASADGSKSVYVVRDNRGFFSIVTLEELEAMPLYRGPMSLL